MWTSRVRLSVQRCILSLLLQDGVGFGSARVNVNWAMIQTNETGKMGARAGVVSVVALRRC